MTKSIYSLLRLLRRAGVPGGLKARDVPFDRGATTSTPKKISSAQEKKSTVSMTTVALNYPNTGGVPKGSTCSVRCDFGYF